LLDQGPAVDTTVKLLCGFDSTIIDESSFARTLTVVGNAAVDTGIKKYGAGSLVMDGAGDRVWAANSADFNFGTGEFGVEGWFRFRTKANSQAMLGVWDNAGTAANNGWYWFIVSGLLTFRIQIDPGTQNDYASAFVPTLGQQYHLAFSRSATHARMFVDGVAVVNQSQSPTSIQASTAALVIGAIGNGAAFGSFDYNGYQDEIRIIKGVAPYTGNFTPPVAAFPRP
jgi:hypothetical protein